MLQNYFEFKTKTTNFSKRINNIIEELQNKKIILCGNYKIFHKLNSQYRLSEKLNIIGFTETESSFLYRCKYKKYKIRQLSKMDYDYILIIDEDYNNVIQKLSNEIEEDKLNIRCLFYEDINNTARDLDYILKCNLEKNLKKLSDKLNDKKILFYGGGLFFQIINEYYDLSVFNSVGVADKNLCKNPMISQVCGYKLYSPEQILELNPDYILVSIRYNTEKIIKDLKNRYLKGTNIKIIPLVREPAHIKILKLLKLYN